MPPIAVAELGGIGSGRAVDLLTDDVGMAEVLAGLGDHVGQQDAKRCVPLGLVPPRHSGGRIQLQGSDRRVGALPDGIVFDPWQRPLRFPAEYAAGVVGLVEREVVDQPEQICRGRDLRVRLSKQTRSH
jgi:hypothetical protein